MREIQIGGEVFQVRGLKLSEISTKSFRRLGYGRFAFRPELDGEDPDKRLSEIMDVALMAVLGEQGYKAADEAGGVAALGKIYKAIMAETYGESGEEKNSSPAGSGSATPGGSTTAPAAASGPAAPASPAAST